ncbi:PEBP-like protein [Tothia fuscella]|uniref:PEBP-like protein n=1 Tax=Tothia fuscella TaxID=1048955 RepID=A0A9P4U1V6_9PEZI|nr:PEBP-like protein [Tothia fuscella]
MLLASASVFVSLLAAVTAQTPSGFAPSVNRTLAVSYGNNSISPAGERFPRAELASPPRISTSLFSTTGKAIVVLIDIDVPRNNTRVPLLHWLVPDVTGVVSGNITTLTIPTTGPGAPYAQPNPPQGDSPHRYIFLLFSQPSNFTWPAAFANINPPQTTPNNTRVGFNITQFISAARLSAPLAANYITVQNTTAGPTTTTYPPALFTVPANSTGTAATTTGTSRSVATATKNAAAVATGGSGVALVMGAAWLVGIV